MPTTIVVLLLGAGFFIYALYHLYLLLKRRKLIEDSKSWPITSGTVTNSVTRYTLSGRGRKHYWAEIAYKYFVLGLENAGAKKLDSLLGLEGTAVNLANTHPIGSTFSVRYNPNNQKEHVVDFDLLSFSDFFKVVIYLILGGLLIVVSAFALLPK